MYGRVPKREKKTVKEIKLIQIDNILQICFEQSAFLKNCGFCVQNWECFVMFWVSLSLWESLKCHLSNPALAGETGVLSKQDRAEVGVGESVYG